MTDFNANPMAEPRKNENSKESSGRLSLSVRTAFADDNVHKLVPKENVMQL